MSKNTQIPSNPPENYIQTPELSSTNSPYFGLYSNTGNYIPNILEYTK